jgi:hypothetical protein
MMKKSSIAPAAVDKYVPKSRADICLYGKHSDVELPRVGAKVSYVVAGTVRSVSKRQNEGDDAPSVDIGINIVKVDRSISDRITERQAKHV